MELTKGQYAVILQCLMNFGYEESDAEIAQNIKSKCCEALNIDIDSLNDVNTFDDFLSVLQQN